MTIALPLLVLIVGLLMFIFSERPKVVRIGEIMMFCGLFVSLLRAPEVLGLMK